MLLSALSVLVVAQSSSEIPEGRMNNPVLMNMHKPVENAASLMNMWRCWHVDRRDRVSQKSWKDLFLTCFMYLFLSFVSAFD